MEENRRGATRTLIVRHSFSVRRQHEGVFSGHMVEDGHVEVCGESDGGELRLVQGARTRGAPSYGYTVDPSSSGVPLSLLDTFPHAPSDVLPAERILPSPETYLAVATHRFFSPVVDHFVGQLSGLRTYNLVAGNGRATGLPVPNGELLSGGWGLPTAVAVLQDTYPDVWIQVLESFIELAPTFTDIIVKPEYDGRLTLGFFEEDGAQQWPAEQVSDGTLRSLALLVALFDPRHRLVVVEEPENSLHPWAIRVILGACRKAAASADKQIVLTTHSPVVIDRMRPDEIYVVWRDDEGTHLSPLAERDPDAPRLWEQGLSDLSGLLDSGWVRESVPLINR